MEISQVIPMVCARARASSKSAVARARSPRTPASPPSRDRAALTRPRCSLILACIIISPRERQEDGLLRDKQQPLLHHPLRLVDFAALSSSCSDITYHGCRVLTTR